MTTLLGKSCLFGLPRVPFVNCCQYMYLVCLFVLRLNIPVNNVSVMSGRSHRFLGNCFPFGFEGRMWDLIVSVLDHCLSFY